MVFKEVVAIENASLKAKIHETYRLAYLKDVILPRVLDDATFATLSSLILFNNVEVPPHLLIPFVYEMCVEALCFPLYTV